jgi:hypothetical protein
VRHYYRARLDTLKEEMYKSICCQDITWRSCSFLNENEVAHFITFMQLSHDKTSVDDGRKKLSKCHFICTYQCQVPKDGERRVDSAG